MGRREIIVRFQSYSKVLVATKFKGDGVVARRLLTQDTEFNQQGTEQHYALTVEKNCIEKSCDVAFFLSGDFPASEFYMPTFRNTPSVPSLWRKNQVMG